MPSRQYVIRNLIDKYIETRKQFYEDCENTIQEHCIKLNAKKHALVNTINNLLDDTEREVIFKDFNAITQYKIDGCSMEDMKGYIVNRERSTFFDCIELQKAALQQTFDDNLGVYMPSIKLPSDRIGSDDNLLEQYKVKWSITSLQKKDKITEFVDYGGEELEKLLEIKPVKMSDCDSFKKLRVGDVSQQLCISLAYLSKKDCVHAKELSMKAFNKDPDNEYNEPIIELIDMLETSGKCVVSGNEL